MISCEVDGTSIWSNRDSKEVKRWRLAAAQPVSSAWDQQSDWVETPSKKVSVNGMFKSLKPILNRSTHAVAHPPSPEKKSIVVMESKYSIFS